MDRPIKNAARNRWIKRIVTTSAVTLAIVAITYGLSRLQPAAPSVDKSTIWMDTVQRGPMLRQVRGLGTLVPEEIFFIPAIHEGQVVKKPMLAGARVTPNTVLLVLRNPEMELAAVETEYQVRAGEAMLEDLRVQLQRDQLNQEAEVARVESEYEQARLQADRDLLLQKEGLIPDIDLQLSTTTAAEIGKRRRIEQQKLGIFADTIRAQIAVQQADVARLKALHQLRREQVEELTVRAGVDGVLQELELEVGQKVAVGTILAKVAQPTRLKAQLRIPETQAKDIQIGQKTEIDTRNGVIPGSVSRIDPAVREGTVQVDVQLEGDLPAGARPDLSVDGTVELERLEDVLYVGRPVYGQPGSLIGIFRLQPEGAEAVRTQVQLGRSSVNTIEILEGLKAGDRVILSDMSNWDAYDRIRLD